MATVILNHKVTDYNTWKQGYDSDKARRENAGMKEIFVGQRHDDPGMAYMIWEVADTSAIDKMMSDPDLQQTMQQAGVISKPEMIILN
ncbi:MAG: hypothetical protein H0X33_08730 [Taibaiella sp.]|nr:hypothetical protein [Taibaiella sp.]